MDDVLSVIDILYVFDKWTLMMNSSQCAGLKVGESIELLDETGKQIGVAIVGAFMRTQNPTIQPIVLERDADSQDLKRVKAVRLQRTA